MTRHPIPNRVLLFVGLVAVLLSAGAYAGDVSAASATKFAIFDRVMDAFKSMKDSWYTIVKSHAIKLFWLLALIDVGYTAVNWVLEKDDIGELAKSMAKKMLTLGFFFAVLKFSDTWIPAIIDSFRQIGMEAGGAGAATSTPDGIIVTGASLALTVIMVMRDLNVLEAVGAVLPLVLTAFVILGAFLWVAATLLLTIVETYIAVSAGVILLGFGGSRWTTDIATKYLQYALSTGLKLMILYLIIGAGQTMFSEIVLDPDDILVSSLVVAVQGVLYAVLAVQAPSIASGMVSGSPAISTGAAMGTAVAMGAAMAGAGAAAASVGGAALGAASNGAASAGGLAKALGAGVSSGLDAGKTGLGLAAHTVGEVAKHGLGLGTEALGSALNKVSSSFADKVESSTGGQIASSIEASRGGSMSGAPGGGPDLGGYSGQSTPAGGSAAAPGATSGASSGASSSPASSASTSSAPASAGGSSSASAASPDTSSEAPAASPTGTGYSSGSGDASGAAVRPVAPPPSQPQQPAKAPLHQRMKELQGYVPQDMAGQGSFNINSGHTQD